MPQKEFERANRDYVRARLSSATPSPHWRPMLEELLADRAKGRVEGPLQALKTRGCNSSRSKAWNLSKRQLTRHLPRCASPWSRRGRYAGAKISGGAATTRRLQRRIPRHTPMSSNTSD